MSLTIEEILDAIAPQIPDDARRATFVTLAKQEVSVTAWGDLYEQAVANLVAHKITLSPVASGGGAALGAFKKKKSGEEELEWHNSAASSADGLSSTSYGQEYLRLRDLAIPSFTHSNVDSDVSVDS